MLFPEVPGLKLIVVFRYLIVKEHAHGGRVLIVVLARAHGPEKSRQEANCYQ